MPKVKHRHSKTRGRKRRTHYKIAASALVKCSQCGKEKVSHKICPYCGYYDGRQIKHIETKEERKARKEKKSKSGKE
ncbi:MAG: 50S ribosomal protein L32 [Candidatus Omnitrophica bacterium]|nr:50S ribosomal protein L32 [Candidatus Omnitrophota bacterium]